MSSRKSPLRDRLLSNSPDHIKSSILRESGMGWNSPPTGSISSATSSGSGSITSPLRIAKRDSPGRSKGADVARRTSSSFRHVRNNNLVSKSPFKSQIPTPSTPSRPPLIFPTRRVSGEKRPRPSSIHNQAETENDRPFALKRDRKQSKGFQGLMEKEPVTKSPFRIHQKPPEEARPPVPRPVSMPIIPSSSQPISHISASAPTDTRPSPGRSSLVSRRMHGPRLSGGPRRERRKTVTFDERCDVVEFDREDSEEEAMESDGERYGFPEPEDAHEIDDEDPFFRGSSIPIQEQHETPDVQQTNDDFMDNDISYESVQLSDPEPNPVVPSLFDPDSSITGLVDQMFSSASADNGMESRSATSTPPRHFDIPTDLETEDGVPFGRSHHVERFLQHHQEHSFISSPHQPPIQPPHFSPRSSPRNSSLVHGSPQQHVSPGQAFPFSAIPSHSSPRSLPATPPHHQSSVPSSTPPLGRSTHVERVLKAKEEGRSIAGEEDLDKLPESPSPMKKPSETGRMSTLEDGLVPRFELPGDVLTNREPVTNIDSTDPFGYSSRENGRGDDLNTSKGDEAMDPANLSIGNSEVSLSGLLRDTLDENNHPLNGNWESDDVRLPSWVGSPLGGSPRFGSPLARAMSPISHSSPLQLASSNGSQSPQTGASGRQRITREDVKRRLLRRRSFGSPGSDDEEPIVASSSQRSPAPSPTSDVDARIQAGETIKTSDAQHRLVDDKEKDRLSIMTTMTDISTETAIVQSAQKVNIDLSVGSLVEAENALWNTKNGLQFDFGHDSFAKSFGGDSMSNGLGVINRQGNVKVGSVNSNESIAAGSVKMGDVDVDMDMKSALDRLMDDVAGAGANGCPDESMMTDDYDESYDNQSNESVRPSGQDHKDFDILQTSKFGQRDPSASSAGSVPPPLPPKDNIKTREQLIIEKRREARRLEDEMDAPVSRGKAQEFRNLGVGRPSRRRSLSTSDAETMGGGAKKRGEALLDVKEVIEDDDPLADSIERELKKLVEKPSAKSKYQIREREGTIYASSSDERISHTTGAGDLNAGKAWRTVRRPSDMNEYSKQIKEYRSQQNPGKAYGKVFVKVLGVKGIHVPLPSQSTIMTCTLNNGIHFVTTPECQLAQDCRIDQEFELIEHSKLEFTLTLKVRRDPHIISQYKSLSPAPPAPPPPQPVVVQPPSRSGMRSFFSSSPKKLSKEKITPQPSAPPPPPPPQRLPENLARYLKPDGTLARAFISFKDVATRCDTRLFETSYPLIGQRIEIGGKFSTLQVGELVLQMFRLPPLPGIPPEELPQSLEECVRGLRHLNWHKVTYFQGTLTQIGGDCSTWRRRQLRVIGSNLVAFNDVTKKATATIDLKKALAVEDDQEGAQGGRRSRSTDDYDGLYGVERSFRLIFPQDHEIVFFADTDEEKARWLEILRALVGHIPPHPLWGELLWQRQEELLKRGQSAHQGAQSPS
ncbi:hypothetical protein BDQ17DRAFT_1273135 [Cyathus striatus]|nr:hypothetical protein BDQ17DRAFT_1273135 [Cyathus striatus]